MTFAKAEGMLCIVNINKKHGTNLQPADVQIISQENEYKKDESKKSMNSLFNLKRP